MGQVSLRRRRCTGRATGRFASRGELTAHVWAIHRQQLYPNLSAIAEACTASVDVIRTILRSEEGLGEYLERGLQLGLPPESGGKAAVRQALGHGSAASCATAALQNTGDSVTRRR